MGGVPIVWRKLLHEQLRNKRQGRSSNSSIIRSYGSVLEAPRRGDSSTDAQLMIIVTILFQPQISAYNFYPGGGGGGLAGQLCTDA